MNDHKLRPRLVAYLLGIIPLIFLVYLFCSLTYKENYSTKITSTDKIVLPLKRNGKFEQLDSQIALPSDVNRLPDSGKWESDFPNVDANGILGLASQFNIFANNLHRNNNQIGGNLAVQNLSTDPWTMIGSSGISYVQQNIDVTDPNTSVVNDIGSTLIVGQSLQYHAGGSWNQPNGLWNNLQGFNKVALNNFTGSFRQDSGGQLYIDFQDQFSRLRNNAKILANESQKNQIVVSPNQYYNPEKTFDLSSTAAVNGTKYVTIKASDISSTLNSIWKGISDTSNIVVTVDTSGQNSVNFENLAFSGTNQSLDGKHILFNFYNDSSQSDFNGQISLTNMNTSNTNIVFALLAPAASVHVASANFQGNIIANNVDQTYSASSNSKFLDVPLSVKPVPAPAVPVISNVPSVDFGQMSIGSSTNGQGNWSQDLTITGQKGQTVGINLALTQNFTDQDLDYAADNVKWHLLNLTNQISTPFSTAAVPATGLTYTIQKDNTAEYPLKNFALVVSNLNSVKYAGDYTATLTWTFTDSP